MNKEKKMNWFNIKFHASKIAAALVAVGGTATTMSCTIWFHEKKVPEQLLSNNPFTDDKE
ncbi:hypothetical protein QUF56_06905 [Ureibacillus composti]|nr:hypothetical protein [Ureibacillus composti]